MDWFIICSFLYCLASILEFAGVHYFTKVGSGETFGNNQIIEEEEFIDDLDTNNEWEDVEEELPVSMIKWSSLPHCPPPPPHLHISASNNLYGFNGSLTDSTESLPVPTKANF